MISPEAEELKRTRAKAARYELIEHTADMGIRVYGKTREELFVNAAWGMFDILADLSGVGIKQSVQIVLQAPDSQELFLAWLRELLYQYNSKNIIFKEFLIKQLGPGLIKAQAQGEKLNLKRHRLKTEIKAVTYHKLRLEQTSNGWLGEVIFDV